VRKKTISHRARRERREEAIDLQGKQIEGLYSVVSEGSSSQPIGPRTLPVKVRLR